MKKRWIIILTIMMLSISSFAQKQSIVEEPGRKSITPQGIVVTPHPGDDYGDYYDNTDLKAWIWTDRQYYKIGQRAKISFKTNRDSHVYIFNKDAKGHTRCIFPNYYSDNNFVQGGRTYHLPDRNYSFRVTGPGGREKLTIVCVAPEYKRDYEGGIILDYTSRNPFASMGISIEMYSQNFEYKLRKKLNSKRLSHNLKNPSRVEYRKNKKHGRKHSTKSIVVEPGHDYPDEYETDHHYYRKTISIYIKREDWNLSKYAPVTIESYPPRAVVKLKGKVIGHTPFTTRLKRNRQHKLELRYKDHHTIRQYISVGKYQDEYDFFFEFIPKH